MAAVVGRFAGSTVGLNHLMRSQALASLCVDRKMHEMVPLLTHFPNFKWLFFGDCSGTASCDLKHTKCFQCIDERTAFQKGTRFFCLLNCRALLLEFQSFVIQFGFTP